MAQERQEATGEICSLLRSGQRHPASTTGYDSYDRLLSHPVLGKSWEGFVVENIHSVLPSRAETHFYRTASGAEIDLVIIMPSSEV